MTRRLLRLAEDAGHDPRALCALADIDLAFAQDRDARIPYPVADRLMEATADLLGAAGLAPRLLGVVELDTYDAAGLLLLTSRTLFEGLVRAFAFQRLWGDGDRFHVEEREASVVVRFQHPGSSALAGAICAELALLETMGAVRMLVAPNARAERVSLCASRPTTPPDVLASFFGVEPIYDAAENELVLARTLADLPIHAPEEWLHHAAELQAHRAIGSLPTQASISDRVRALTGTGFEWISLTVHDAAKRLRMSPRTLQRKLQQEGTSFDRVVDEARRERVERALRGGASAKEAAFLVGFADASALTKARARWRRD